MFSTGSTRCQDSQCAGARPTPRAARYGRSTSPEYCSSILLLDRGTVLADQGAVPPSATLTLSSTPGGQMHRQSSSTYWRGSQRGSQLSPAARLMVLMPALERGSVLQGGTLVHPSSDERQTSDAVTYIHLILDFMWTGLGPLARSGPRGRRFSLPRNRWCGFSAVFRPERQRRGTKSNTLGNVS